MTLQTDKSTPIKINGHDIEALNNTIAAIQAQPSLASTTFRATGRWIDDRLVRTSVSSFHGGGTEQQRQQAHELDTDLPVGLLGQDRGPSPLELALSALASCVTTTLASHAAARGLQIDALEVHVDGSLDLQGFLGLDENVRPGYRKIRVDIHLESSASAEVEEDFVRSAIGFSPLWDMFQNGTDLETRTHLS